MFRLSVAYLLVSFICLQRTRSARDEGKAEEERVVSLYKKDGVNGVSSICLVFLRLFASGLPCSGAFRLVFASISAYSSTSLCNQYFMSSTFVHIIVLTFFVVLYNITKP
jgi:hypothetical protein